MGLKVRVGSAITLFRSSFQRHIALGDFFREFVRLAGVGAAERSFVFHVLTPAVT